jgi:hypothetical protein
VGAATDTTPVASGQRGVVDVRSAHRVPTEALRMYLAAARNSA